MLVLAPHPGDLLLSWTWPRTFDPHTNMSQTPGRVTRSRSRETTPALPSLASKTSHAYGAQGKANLRAQIAVHGADISSAFPATIAEELEPQSSPQNGHEDDGEKILEGETDRSTTFVDPKSTYNEHKMSQRDQQQQPRRTRLQQKLATQVVAQPPQLQEQAQQPELPQAQPDDVPAQHEPGDGTVLSRVLLRFWPAAARYITPDTVAVLKMIALIPLTMLVLLWCFSTCSYMFMSIVYTTADLVPLGATIQPYQQDIKARIRVFMGASPYDQPPQELEVKWMNFTNAKFFADLYPQEEVFGTYQAYININHVHRLNELDERVQKLEERVTLQDASIEALHGMLPAHLLVKEIDGRYEIPHQFWGALQERLGAVDDTTAPIWDAFVQGNREQLKQIGSQTALAEIENAVEHKHIVSRSAFISALEENHEHLLREYKKDIHQLMIETREQINDIAADAVAEKILKVPANKWVLRQLEQVVNSHQAQNAFEALHTINFFSPGLGARIDPHQTSPTYRTNSTTWLQWLYKHSSPFHTPANPPIAALQRWDEATDCWCAAPSTESGKAAIGIILPFKIYPDKLVVEHMPPHGTLNIAAAPRDFEVWVNTRSEDEAKRIEAATLEVDPRWHWQERCGEKPGKSWVCITANQYNIHGLNHIQTFETAVDSPAIGLAVDNIVVRISSNWGADATCVYRLRMTGEKVLA